MEILEAAIKREGGVGKLATALGLRHNVVSNWRNRKLPKSWEVALGLKYGLVPLSPACTTIGVTPAPACVCDPAAAQQQPGAFCNT